MRKTFKVNLFIFIVMTLIVLICQKSFAIDDGDFQYWNTESVSFKIGDDWKGKLEEEFRFSDDGGDFTYQHSDLSFTYSGLADWLDLGIAYRHIFEKRGDDWPRESRPHLSNY